MVSSDLAGFTTQCGDAPFDGEIFRLAKTSCAVFSKHSLHVTNKAVDVTLPRRFVNDVFVVVVAQATTQLLIVHFGLFLHWPHRFATWRIQERRLRIFNHFRATEIMGCKDNKFTFTFSHLADAFIQSDLQLGSA